jgi:hypothetical protein
MMVRPLAHQTFSAMLMDEWPGVAACVDFGLVDQAHYEALCYPIRRGEIDLEQLDRCLGSGVLLTALVARCAANPHKGIVFSTPYDDWEEDEELTEDDSDALDGAYASMG